MKTDRNTVARGLAQTLVILLLGTMFCGCSNFRANKRINLAPFAENTVNLLADIRYGMDAQTAVYLRDYVDIPEVRDYSNAWKEYRPMLRGVAAYSIAIVTISKSNLTEKERSGKLADVLEEMLRPRVAQTGDKAILPEVELDRMLADIRNQKKFLDALNSAQPLVDAIEVFSHGYLDDLKDQLDVAQAAIDKRVRSDHAASQAFYKELVNAQNFAFEDLVFLRNYRQGYDADALEKLLDHDPQLKAIIPQDRTPTMDDLNNVQERIIYRLARIREMTEQVQPDLDLYRNKMWELDALAKGANNNLTKTRVTVIIWSRSHRGLASGIIDPARFDVMGIAKRALSAALPI